MTQTTTATIPTHIISRIRQAARTNNLPTTRAAALQMAGSPVGGWESQERLDAVVASIQGFVNGIGAAPAIVAACEAIQAERMAAALVS